MIGLVIYDSIILRDIDEIEDELLSSDIYDRSVSLGFSSDIMVLKLESAFNILCYWSK